MSEPGSIERQYDAALVRVRKAFDKGKLPASIGDLQLALQSEHVTVGEVDALTRLIGDVESLHPS